MYKRTTKYSYYPQKQNMLKKHIKLGVFALLIGLSVLYIPTTRPVDHRVFAIPTQKNITVPAPTTTPVKADYRIVIPSIDVDSSIVPVGKKANGDMAATSELNQTGWYKYGPRPGDIGNAVIVGHYSNDNSAIFYRLHDLALGSIVEIHDKTNVKHFKVIKKEAYTPENAPQDEIFGASSRAQLNLITCSGIWKNKSFTHRLVVYTELVN